MSTPDLGVSLRAIEAKTAVLWDRVSSFTRKYQPGEFPSCLISFADDLTTCTESSPQTLQALMQEFNGLSSILESLTALLPTADPQALVRVQDVQKARRAGVIYSMLCAAVIRLNGPLASSGNDGAKRKRLAMARVILETVLAMRSRGPGYLNPIIGVSIISFCHYDSHNDTSPDRLDRGFASRIR